MADALDQALALMYGGDVQTEIAAQNPWYSFADVGTNAASAIMQAYASNENADTDDIKEAAILSAVAGLIGGSLKGFGHDYQSKLTDRYLNTVEGFETGFPISVRESGLSSSLYGSAKRRAKLFEKVKGLEELKINLKANEAAATAGGNVLGEHQANQEIMGKGDQPFGIGKVAEQAQRLESETYKRITDLPTYKQFNDIAPNFKTLVNLAPEDNISANIGMISAIARILDPGSTVKQGEYDINANAQAILDKVAGRWREVVMGKSRLQDVDKKRMVSAAHRKYESFGPAYQKQAQPHLEILQQLGQKGGLGLAKTVPAYEPFDFKMWQKGFKTVDRVEGSAPTTGLSPKQALDVGIERGIITPNHLVEALKKNTITQTEYDERIKKIK